MRRAASVAAALLLAATALSIPSARAASYDDSTCETTPVPWTNDPCAGRQWGIENVSAPQAWAAGYDGTGVTVAVVDTGADFHHPDLSANLVAVPGSDIVQNSAYACPGQTPGPNASNAIAQDDNGHGTHVSGTIAALTGNGTGVAGVAPGARVMPVKVLDETGSGADADIARGICFAVDHGAKIVNLSLGADPLITIVASLGSDTEDAITYAHDRGVAVIVAAGNEGFPACDFPASITRTLCVGAVDENDVKAWYSNFGANIGVMAPGGLGSVFCSDDLDVWSTVLPGAVDCSEDGYETLSGTSMAAPHASAVAAMVVQRYGASSTPDFVYATLKSTADDAGLPGEDPAYGAGRVNAAAAVGAAASADYASESSIPRLFSTNA